jgi:hypothetical protein
VFPRKDFDLKEIIEKAAIPIYPYVKHTAFTNQLTYVELVLPEFRDNGRHLDIMWVNSQLALRGSPVGWSGAMRSAHAGQTQKRSSIVFQPMIDLNPTDLTCINTTLMFIAEKAKKLNQIPVVTFDQPLYWKARMMVESSPFSSPLKEIVVMLGSFHGRMSFLGCMGYLMEEAGLVEVLEQIYAPNTVKHIISGKAVSRAMTAHSPLDLALHILLFACAFEDTADGLRSQPAPQMVSAASVYTELTSENISIEDLSASPAVVSLLEEIEQAKKELVSESRTAKLWLEQYSEMNKILWMSVRAERTGDFDLYLQTWFSILPYFAA